MSDLQILHPQWLLLLLPLWLLLAICTRKMQQESIWQGLCDQHLLAHMTAGQVSSARHSSTLWLIGSLLTLGIVVAAAPSWSRVKQPLLEATTARVIILDLSRAMLVQDLKPDRYQHSAAAVSELLDKEYDGETGLVVFSAAAFVVAPLSRDAETLQAFAEAMHPDTMPVDGYNLAQAIRSAQALLAASFGGHGDILVLSAGDSHDESAINAASAAALEGNRVFILAIGSEAGGPVVDANGGLLRDPDGKVQISKTNFALLQRIADAGNGNLAVAVADLANDDLLMSRLGASELVESVRMRTNSDAAAADDGIWLVWLMLPLTLMLFRKNVIWLLLLILLPVEQESFAADSPGFWKHTETIAFEAYLRQDFATAATLAADPLLRGASLYQRGEYQLALQQFNDENSATSMYNRGNTLVQLQRYTEAIRAYQQALILDPDLGFAIHNKRLLELYLQQQSEAANDAQIGDIVDANDAANAESAMETQIGIANELQRNPADEQGQGPGLGAAQRSGQVDPLEHFFGEEDAQQRFVLRALTTQHNHQDELIERWINSLPETSSELYRRKFLRDYRRQQGRLP